MQDKPKLKRTTPRRWQTQLLDWLRLSSAFEVKVNLSAAECLAYLANVLPDRIENNEYTFEEDEQTPENRFWLTKYSGFSQKNRTADAHLVGILHEEPNLVVTTISGKVYPNFYAVIILLINVLIFFPLVSDMVKRGIAESWFDLLCFVPILSLFAIGSVLSFIGAFRDRRALKNYLITRVDKLDGKNTVPTLS